MTKSRPESHTAASLRKLVLYEIKRLGNTCNLNHIDVSTVKDFTGIFASTQFNGDISKWHVARGKKFANMFEGCPFNGDVSAWDVSAGLDFSNMFESSFFEGDLSQWNTARATDFRRMFAHTLFNGDISRWNTSRVLSMECMFSNSAFAGDVSQWDVSNVRNFRGMFLEAPFDGDLSTWTFHPESANVVRLVDMVAHHKPGMRKNLQLPLLPVEGYRLFLSKATMHAWLAARASHGDIGRYHWDALLREPHVAWASPQMTQLAQTYLALVTELPATCIEHSDFLMQSWTKMSHPTESCPLPALDEASP